MVVNPVRCEKLRHDSVTQGEGRCSQLSRDVAKDDDMVNSFEFVPSNATNDKSVSDKCDSNIDGNNSTEKNVGLPEILCNTLRQSAIRMFKNQNCYAELEVILDDVNEWEELPNYVGMTDSVSLHLNTIAVSLCIA